jgi:hypothetical protein
MSSLPIQLLLLNVAGVMMRDGQRVTEHLLADNVVFKEQMAHWLAGRPSEIREALLVTYFKQGPSYLTRFKERLRRQAYSSAVLVPGEGCRVFDQRAKFKEALGTR